MRIVGLDIGERRIGVAISDPQERVASPLTVLDYPGRAIRELHELAEEYEAGLVVVGLPTSMDGTEGPQAARVREIADEMARELRLPLVYYDERLTTAEALKSMRSAGVRGKKRKESVDKVAAAILLQAYLDSRSRGERRDNE